MTTPTDQPVTLTCGDPWGLIGSAWQPPLRVSEIVYSFTTKVNLGNYESCDVFLSMKAPVDQDQCSEEVYDQLRTLVKDHVRTERRSITDALAKRITEPRGR